MSLLVANVALFAASGAPAMHGLPTSLNVGGLNVHEGETCRCTISTQKLGPPRTVMGQSRQRRQPTRYLFLLGYPYTGTTAFHALLAQGTNVSALDDINDAAGRQNLLSPDKKGSVSAEGWGKLGWKQREDRWSAPDSAFNWTNLSVTYHRLWNLKRPLLVENSPPEVTRADALNRTFSPRGKVRFVVLTHSMCAHDGEISNACDHINNGRTSDLDCWCKRASHAIDIARRYGDDAIVVRYEDLCLQWDETTKALESWEPLLGGLSRLRENPVEGLWTPSLPGFQEEDVLHTHRAMSFLEYCMEVNSPKWKAGVKLVRPVNPANEGLKTLQSEGAGYLGYTSVDKCVWSDE